MLSKKITIFDTPATQESLLNVIIANSVSDIDQTLSGNELTIKGGEFRQVDLATAGYYASTNGYKTNTKFKENTLNIEDGTITLRASGITGRGDNIESTKNTFNISGGNLKAGFMGIDIGNSTTGKNTKVTSNELVISGGNFGGFIYNVYISGEQSDVQKNSITINDGNFKYNSLGKNSMYAVNLSDSQDSTATDNIINLNANNKD